MFNTNKVIDIHRLMESPPCDKCSGVAVYSITFRDYPPPVNHLCISCTIPYATRVIRRAVYWSIPIWVLAILLICNWSMVKCDGGGTPLILWIIAMIIPLKMIKTRIDNRTALKRGEAAWITYGGESW